MYIQNTRLAMGWKERYSEDSHGGQKRIRNLPREWKSMLLFSRGAESSKYSTQKKTVENKTLW